MKKTFIVDDAVIPAGCWPATLRDLVLEKSMCGHYHAEWIFDVDCPRPIRIWGSRDGERFVDLFPDWQQAYAGRPEARPENMDVKSLIGKRFAVEVSLHIDPQGRESNILDDFRGPVREVDHRGSAHGRRGQRGARR